jgi:hypothetical protein
VRQWENEAAARYHTRTHAYTHVRTPHTHTPHKWCTHTPTPTHNSPLVQQWVVPTVRVVLRVKLLRCVRLQHHTRNMSSSLGQILSARDGMMLAERGVAHCLHTLCGGWWVHSRHAPTWNAMQSRIAQAAITMVALGHCCFGKDGVGCLSTQKLAVFELCTLCVCEHCLVPSTCLFCCPTQTRDRLFFPLTLEQAR